MTPQHRDIPNEHDEVGIRAVLSSFSQAMAEGNTQAAIGHWEAPALVISGQGNRTLNSAVDLHAFFAPVRQHYNREGAAMTRPDVSNIHQSAGDIAMVTVRWPHLDEESNELGAEAWTYLLRRNAKREWKIRVGVLHSRADNWDLGE